MYVCHKNLYTHCILHFKWDTSKLGMLAYYHMKICISHMFELKNLYVHLLLHFEWELRNTLLACLLPYSRSGSRGGLPLKLEKNWFFGIKSWFFTRNTHKISVPPFAWCNFFKCAPPNFKSWILPCIQICIYLQVGSDYFWMVIAFFDFACLLITISGFACCHSDFIWKIYDHNNFNFCSRWLILL